MSFSPGGGAGSGSVAGSSDVSLDNPNDYDVLSYDTEVGKWSNQPVAAENVIGFAESVHKVVINVRTVAVSTVVAADDEYLRIDSASPATVTLPVEVNDDLATGYSLTIRQAGAGQVTVTATGGVTINGNLKTTGQNSSISLIKVGPSAWDAEGGMA